MEFFETFWVWLDLRLAFYINANTERVAFALTPVIVVLGTVYVMVWGYLQMMGKIDEPFSAGLKRILTLAIVLGMCLHLWLYNNLIVDTFYEAPAQLASAVVGASDPVQVIDRIWARGASAAENLQARSSWHSLDFLVMAYLIRFAVALLCVYTVFLISLSKVALAVLIALGPFFIVMLLFEQTQHYFRSWIALLSNYAMVTIVAILVCSMILGLVEQYAAATFALGIALTSADALNLVLVCALAFLFMLQVPQIAASLTGGGLGLNTHGAGQRSLAGVTSLVAVGGVGAAGFLRGLFTSKAPTAGARKDWGTARRAGHAVRVRLVGRNSIESTR